MLFPLSWTGSAFLALKVRCRRLLPGTENATCKHPPAAPEDKHVCYCRCFRSALGIPSGQEEFGGVGGAPTFSKDRLDPSAYPGLKEKQKVTGGAGSCPSHTSFPSVCVTHPAPLSSLSLMTHGRFHSHSSLISLLQFGRRFNY